MLILFIDLETTQDKPVEIGLIAYDTEHQCMVSCFSTLLYADVQPEISVHKIPTAAILGQGWLDGNTLELANILCGTIWCENDFSYVLAHNAKFEQQYIDTSIPWLCTYKDFDLFPQGYAGKRDLISLAQWHGVGVSVSHRAIYDCLLMVEIFNRIDNLPREIDYALRPKVEWIAPLYDKEGNKITHAPPSILWDYDLQGWIGKKGSHTTGDVFYLVGERVEMMVEKSVSFEHKDTAKQWGFKWDGDRKIWSRLINPATAKHFPFPLESTTPTF